MNTAVEATTTYEVEYLVHLNVSYRVEATDEDTAYEASKTLHEGFLSAHDAINENLAFTENIGVKRVTKTTVEDIRFALENYEAEVEANTRLEGNEDDYDAVLAVINAVRRDDHTPLYEVQESASEHRIQLDLEDENVCGVIWTGLVAMTDLWAFERGLSAHHGVRS